MYNLIFFDIYLYPSNIITIKKNKHVHDSPKLPYILLYFFPPASGNQRVVFSHYRFVYICILLHKWNLAVYSHCCLVSFTQHISLDIHSCGLV